jgi:hypothetical protein
MRSRWNIRLGKISDRKKNRGGNRREKSSFGKTVTNGESWLIYDPHRVKTSKQGEEVDRK